MAKKEEFYTVHHANGKFKLVKHSGYTENGFQFYGQCRVWHMIDPNTGASIARSDSVSSIRKKAKDKKLLKKLDSYKKTKKYTDLINNFERLKRGKRK